MLRKIPTWSLQWAPRATRATLVSPTSKPLIKLTPESAEGHHHFGDHATLIENAPALLQVARDIRLWLATLPHLGGDTEEERQAVAFDLDAAIKRAEGEST
jgi:hypothetical protein